MSGPVDPDDFYGLDFYTLEPITEEDTEDQDDSLETLESMNLKDDQEKVLLVNSPTTSGSIRDVLNSSSTSLVRETSESKILSDDVDDYNVDKREEEVLSDASRGQDSADNNDASSVDTAKINNSNSSIVKGIEEEKKIDNVTPSDDVEGTTSSRQAAGIEVLAGMAGVSAIGVAALSNSSLEEDEDNDSTNGRQVERHVSDEEIDAIRNKWEKVVEENTTDANLDAELDAELDTELDAEMFGNPYINAISDSGDNNNLAKLLEEGSGHDSEEAADDDIDIEATDSFVADELAALTNDDTPEKEADQQQNNIEDILKELENEEEEESVDSNEERLRLEAEEDEERLRLQRIKAAALADEVVASQHSVEMDDFDEEEAVQQEAEELALKLQAQKAQELALETVQSQHSVEMDDIDKQNSLEELAKEEELKMQSAKAAALALDVDEMETDLEEEHAFANDDSAVILDEDPTPTTDEADKEQAFDEVPLDSEEESMATPILAASALGVAAIATGVALSGDEPEQEAEAEEPTDDIIVDEPVDEPEQEAEAEEPTDDIIVDEPVDEPEQEAEAEEPTDDIIVDETEQEAEVDEAPTDDNVDETEQEAEADEAEEMTDNVVDEPEQESEEAAAAEEPTDDIVDEPEEESEEPVADDNVDETEQEAEEAAAEEAAAEETDEVIADEPEQESDEVEAEEFIDDIADEPEHEPLEDEVSTDVDDVIADEPEQESEEPVADVIADEPEQESEEPEADDIVDEPEQELDDDIADEPEQESEEAEAEEPVDDIVDEPEQEPEEDGFQTESLDAEEDETDEEQAFDEVPLDSEEESMAAPILAASALGVAAIATGVALSGDSDKEDEGDLDPIDDAAVAVTGDSDKEDEDNNEVAETTEQVDDESAPVDNEEQGFLTEESFDVDEDAIFAVDPDEPASKDSIEDDEFDDQEDQLVTHDIDSVEETPVEEHTVDDGSDLLDDAIDTSPSLEEGEILPVASDEAVDAEVDDDDESFAVDDDLIFEGNEDEKINNESIKSDVSPLGMESQDGEKSMVSTLTPEEDLHDNAAESEPEPILEEEASPEQEEESIPVTDETEPEPEPESPNETVDKKDDDSLIAALDDDEYSFDDEEAAPVPVPAPKPKKKVQVPVAPPRTKPKRSYNDTPKRTTFAKAQSRATVASTQTYSTTSMRTSSRTASRGKSPGNIHLQLYEKSYAQQEKGRLRRQEVENKLRRRADERNGIYISGSRARLLNIEKRDSFRNEFEKPIDKITIEQAESLYHRLVSLKERTEERKLQLRKEREDRELAWLNKMSTKKISLEDANKIYYRGTVVTRSRSRGRMHM